MRPVYREISDRIVPSRERVSKLHLAAAPALAVEVAPFAGAWIETSFSASASPGKTNYSARSHRRGG
jgi:hypothetical protein